MKNLRTLVIQPEDLKTFNPQVMVERMLNAGFAFDHIGCPVKITQPWDRQDTNDGCVVFRQWDCDHNWVPGDTNNDPFRCTKCEAVAI